MRHKNKIIFGVLAVTGLIGIAIFANHVFSKKKATLSVLVQITSPKYMTISKTLITYGTLSYTPEQIQPLSVQNEALVEQIFVANGQRVKKDDFLVKLALTHASFLSLQTAKINVDYAQKDLNRLMRLRAQFLATNADIQTAKENLVKAEAQLQNIIAQQKNENGNILPAPSNGTVTSINVTTGQLISPSTAILNFASDNSRQVQLGVESEDLPQIHIGQEVRISSVQQKNLTFVGHIKEIAGQIDPSTGLITVIVPVNQPIPIVSGSMVEGEIILNPGIKTLTVPRSAVLYQKNQPYLFVEINKKARKRWIKIGQDNGAFVSVLSGLNKNEEVIILGNYELKEGMNLRMDQSS